MRRRKNSKRNTWKSLALPCAVLLAEKVVERLKPKRDEEQERLRIEKQITRTAILYKLLSIFYND